MTSTPTRPVDNVVIATKGLQDRNTNIIAGTTGENKGKLILTYRKRPLEIPRRRWEDNIRMDLKEMSVNTRN